MKNANKLTNPQQANVYQIFFGKMQKDLNIRHSIPMLLIDLDKWESSHKNGNFNTGKFSNQFDKCDNKSVISYQSFHLVPANRSLQLKVKNKRIIIVVLNVITHDFDRLAQWLMTLHSHGDTALQHDKLVSQNLERVIQLIFGQLARPQQDSRVLQAATILNDRIGINILIQDLATEVCLSVPRLVQLFKQCTGLTIRRYRLLIRVNFVVSLVCAGESPSYASAEAGFADYSHFSRSFKEMLGMNPKDMLSDITALSCVYRFCD